MKMMERIAEASPRFQARMAGVFAWITTTAAFAEIVRSRLVVYGDAAATAHNILAHELLFRLAFAGDVIATLYIAYALLLYNLFRPVNRSLSLLAALFSLAGCANEILRLFHLAPYKINSLVFFGPYCLLLGYLIFRSTFLPRILGVLMACAGLGWLIYMSPLANHLTTYLKVLGFLAEASLMLWLIVKGVNARRWKEQAGGARSSDGASGGLRPTDGVDLQ
jgi:hypothetical protein